MKVFLVLVMFQGAGAGTLLSTPTCEQVISYTFVMTNEDQQVNPGGFTDG